MLKFSNLLTTIIFLVKFRSLCVLNFYAGIVECLYPSKQNNTVIDNLKQIILSKFVFKGTFSQYCVQSNINYFTFVVFCTCWPTLLISSISLILYSNPA